ncbi:hypothetical protein D081_1267 [Anaerovibrio sp. JC8]|uniref:restriction endonuclease n=1 Tax=Anaerovibrio sp. JC8 TaxID=1240085 RepID=UPI000A0BCFD7|nr:restriction endonuclease [Anaerovibrio sp. JC8]ORU00173.1 hypothetical protein D081_1267 [Anaerovibrio sp. JC8]
MNKRYYLHRISHEDYVSYSLLESGYLTLGWGYFAGTDILDAVIEGNMAKFEEITTGCSRSRWSIWYFAKMNIGDTVVVPLYGGKFSVFKVVELAKSISELETIMSTVKTAWGNNKLTWKEHRIYDDTNNRCIDLGFYIKVEPIVKNVPRSFVDSKFVSRMKIRVTTADITDIKANVEDGIQAGINNKPILLYEETIDDLVIQVKQSIVKNLDDSKFEKIIKWYLEKCGASLVWIPAKNEAGKVDGADADIIAEFDNLKFTVYVQAKHHEGDTDEWSVEQIKRYKDQKETGDEGCTYATWVISSADSFTDRAKILAAEYGVRLVNGNDFARMLIDIGLLDINKAF